MDTGNKLAESWIQPLLKRLRTTLAQELAEEILSTDSNNWWYENIDANYWVIGGKDHLNQTT